MRPQPFVLRTVRQAWCANFPSRCGLLRGIDPLLAARSRARAVFRLARLLIITAGNACFR